MEPEIVIVCNTANSTDQVDTLRLELEQQNRRVSVGHEGNDVVATGAVAACKSLVVFLNDKVMKQDDVVAAVRSYSGENLVLVYETDGRHGALFNEDGALTLTPSSKTKHPAI